MVHVTCIYTVTVVLYIHTLWWSLHGTLVQAFHAVTIKGRLMSVDLRRPEQGHFRWKLPLNRLYPDFTRYYLIRWHTITYVVCIKGHAFTPYHSRIIITQHTTSPLHQYTLRVKLSSRFETTLRDNVTTPTPTTLRSYGWTHLYLRLSTPLCELPRYKSKLFLIHCHSRYFSQKTVLLFTL